MSDLTKGQPLIVEDLDLSKLKRTVYRHEDIALRRADGTIILPTKGPTFRSCWNCNPAHEHLKTCRWLVCFACDKTYHTGVEST